MPPILFVIATAILLASPLLASGTASSSPGSTTMSQPEVMSGTKTSPPSASSLRRELSLPPSHGLSGGSSGGGGDDPDLTGSDIVAFSSRLIAAARAMETRRADRLFDDPFAEVLAGNEAIGTYEERQKQARADGGDQDAGSNRRLAIRTRFCDDFFESCTISAGIKQIVLLGAGMDTRGLRLKAAAGTKVYEVDQASVLRVKHDLLSQAAGSLASSIMKGKGEHGPEECASGEWAPGRAQVVAVEADLCQPGWEGELFNAGFDRSLPSAWILEGLTMYLEEHELLSLLRVLASLSSPGSALCSTFVSAASVDRASKSESAIMKKWRFGTDDSVAFMAANFPDGWSFDGVTCGTPGNYPKGADYEIGFKGKGPAYVVGILQEISENRTDAGNG